MGAALPFFAVASVALSALGQVTQGIAGKRAGDYNAVVARNNAVHAVRAGQAQATNVGLRSAAEGGRIKAGQAANNISVNDGSALKVQEGQRAAGAVDQTNTNNDALIKAYGYQAQGELERSKGNAAMTQGILGAAGTLAGGASKFGDVFGSSTPSKLGQSLQDTAAAGAYAEEG